MIYSEEQTALTFSIMTVVYTKAQRTVINHSYNSPTVDNTFI